MRPAPRCVPCARGCAADAWSVEPDGRLHFVACAARPSVEEVDRERREARLGALLVGVVLAVALGSALGWCLP